MSANQSMAVESRSGGWGNEVGVNDRNLSNLARREIKKSQSLHHRAGEQSPNRMWYTQQKGST